MRRAVTLALALVALALRSPDAVRAQSIFDLLESIRMGGGWVEIPVSDGRGKLVTRPLPTAGLTLEGCMQVYAGHSGTWEIRARDPYGEEDLEFVVAPGEPKRFRYRTGARGQLEVDARWSEPRDTILLVWVGLKSPLQPERDVCAPSYGSG